MMPATETIQFHAPPALRQQLEREAARLNLSLGAYIIYVLEARGRSGVEGARLDRHVREVFGRHGDLIRRLAR